MANKLRDEDLNLNIIVNGDKGKKELGDLEKSTRELLTRNKELRAEKDKLIRAGQKETQEYTELTAKMKALVAEGKKESDQYRELYAERNKLVQSGKKYTEQYKTVSSEITSNNRKIKENETRMTELRKEMGLTGLTMKQLRSEQTRLKRLMDSSTPGTPQWKMYRAELDKVEAQMAKVRGGSQRMQLSIGKMADGFNRYFNMLAVWAASFTGIVLGFRKASNEFALFDDQVADVQKTTGLTKEEVLDLDKSLQELDTRTAQNDLLGLSRIAGKLGVEGVDNVEGFVRAADKIKVALTEDLGGDVEESINQIGKLTDIFGLEQEFGIERSMLKVGSTINSLGAASTANEGYIVEFTKRVAGIAPSANISIDKVMGLAATLDQFGQTSEVSSTVYSQVIPDMFKDTATYADIANMSVTDFKDLLNKDANEAFIKFLEGLRGNNGGLQEMVRKLDGLGLEGKRSISVLGVLANNTNTLREQQALANVEFEKGTSLTDEFNIKNNTRQAQMEKSRKQLALITRELGENLSPAVLISTNGVTYFIRSMVELIRITRQYYPIIISSAAAIVAYTIAMKLSTAAKRADFLQTKLGIALEKGYAVAKSLVTGQIKIATIAQRAWNAAVKANPIGAVLAVVIAVGAAIWQYSKNLDKATASQKALNDLEQEVIQNTVEQKVRVEQLLKVARDEQRSMADRLAALKELNQISPEYFGNLTLERLNTEQAKKATDDYIKSIEQKARVEAAYQQLVELDKKHNTDIASGEAGKVSFWQSVWNNIKAGGNAAVAANFNAMSSVENLTKAEQDYLDVKKTLTAIIDEGSKKTNDGPAVGDRKTIGNKVYEWTGKDWKEVQDLDGGGDLTDKEIKQRIEKMEAGYNQELALIQKRHLEGKTSEDQYNADLLHAELKFLNDKLSIYKKGSKEYEQAVNQAMEKQVEVDRTLKNLLLQAEKELAAAKIENLQDGLQKQEALENQRWENEKLALQKRLIDKTDLSAQEIALNDAINLLIEQKEAEHQKKMQDLKEASKIQDLQDLETAATPIDPNFATPGQQQAQFDARMALIEAQYAREKRLAGNNKAAALAAERNYNQQVYQLKSAQIDAEYALTERRLGTYQNYVSMLSGIVDEESALGKALFLFNQALAIGDVWVNIAKANAKAIAFSPLTMGQPWVTTNTVQGGIQTALILAQTVARFTKKKGKKDGGYTGQAASDDQVMGVYHANEWFANAKAVRNPEVKQFLDVFDYYQRTGQISKLNTQTIMASIPASGQMATGGYSSQPKTESSSSNLTQPYTYSSTQYPELLKAVNRLNNNLEKGIRAKLYYREFEEYEDDVKSIRNNASL